MLQSIESQRIRQDLMNEQQQQQQQRSGKSLFVKRDAQRPQGTMSQGDVSRAVDRSFNFSATWLGGPGVVDHEKGP